MAVVETPGRGLAIPARRVGTSFWHAAWRRFVQNKMAVFGLVYVILMILVAVFAPWIAPYRYDRVNYLHALEEPSLRFPFGTDELGRDMFSRVIYSVRNAVIVAFGATFVALIIGAILGAIAGYRGGLIDNLLMRFVEIMIGIPDFFLQIILVISLGRGLHSIALALGLTAWAGCARLVRGQVLAVRNREYIEAARSVGAPDRHIVRHYVFPNILGPILVWASFTVPGMMLAEGALSFIGLGLRPPMPSWGNLLQSGGAMMLGFPYLMLYPALTFAVTLLAFRFLSDGLRDAFNPKGDT